jgi:hypothetical protein
MRLLLLGLLVVWILTAGARHRAWRYDSDCWRWRDDVRERAFEAREEARERARESRDERRAHRHRMRDDMRHWSHDWRYDYDY